MKYVFDDELFCSLKNELSEVSAQIDAQSAKLMGLIDQKKNIRSTDSGNEVGDTC